MHELYNYIKKTKTINKNVVISSVIFLCLFFALLYPWNSIITIPAVITFAEKEDIYAPFDVESNKFEFKNGDGVKKGQELAFFTSDDLNYKLQVIDIKIKILKEKIKQEYGNTKEYGYKQADSSIMEALIIQKNSILAEKEKLVVRSRLKGVIINKSPLLKNKQWLQKDELLFSVADKNSLVVKAYFPEYVLKRIGSIKEAMFYPEDINLPSITLRGEKLNIAAAKNLKYKSLSSKYGGEIATVDDELRLKDSYFQVSFIPIDSVNFDFEVKGKVAIKVKRESFLRRFYLNIAEVIIRESNF